MKKRKIVAITGTRAEYGLATSIFRSIDNHPNLELGLIATGMHLSRKFGYTVKEIEKDKFKIVARIKNLFPEDTGIAMAKSIGKCMLDTIEILEKSKPDILLVLTDLGHTLAGAIVGAYMNIPVAHVHGGDVSGTVDEPARHAITKLSHIHFAATKKSAERILKMGEEPWRIYTVGAPGLDSILNEKIISPKKLAKKFNLDLSAPIILVVQHPVTTEVEDAEEQMKKTMEVIKELGHQSIVIYPNADAGGRKIIKVIEQYKKYGFIKIYKNLPRFVYLGFMNIANVMVGNSSSGIIEAPSFHLPVINIGTRQSGRERSINVIDVDHDKKAIKKAIYDKKFREEVKRCKNPYGDGKAGIRIANILSKIKIDKKMLQKKITY